MSSRPHQPLHSHSLNHADYFNRPQPNSKPWLPIGYMTAEKAAFQFDIPESWMTNPKTDKRDVLHKMMACKGCNLKVRGQVKDGSLCNDSCYCCKECEAKGWTPGHKNECSREKKSKGAGHISKDSGDDSDDQAQKDALDSFAIDLHRGLAGGGTKKTTRKKNETYQWMYGGLAIEDRCAPPT